MLDPSTLGVISTLLMAFAIVGISWWAFSPKRRQRFRDDAQLPFADDENDTKPQQDQPERQDKE